MERPASTLFVILSKFVMLLLLCDFHSTSTAVLADDVMVAVDVTITDVNDTSCSSTSSLPVTEADAQLGPAQQRGHPRGDQSQDAASTGGGSHEKHSPTAGV